MDSLPPIPTPAGQRWREFRIQALPLLVFSCIVIAAAFLWRSLIIPMNLVGQAEAVTASVTVTVPGLIESLSADRFAEVTNGQEIATLIPFDPDFTSASLSTIESDLNVTKARMDLNELARLDTAVRLRLDLETQRTLLSVAQVQYTEAESILERNKKLLQDNIISQAAFDLLRLNRDRWKTEVEERTKVIAEWRREVENFGPRLTNSFAGMDLIIQKDVEAQQEQLRQQQKRIILRAPISGKVSAVLHRANERVPAGTAILTITPLHPERIVAYVRQPITVYPKVGDNIRVSTRTPHRRVSVAQVVQVGTQMEPINPILLPLAKAIPEEGLPIAISLPPELNLLAGEVVSLTLMPPEK